MFCKSLIGTSFILCSVIRLSAISPADKWSLWNSGKTQLRGVNIWQRIVYPELDGDYLGDGPVGPPFTQKEFDDLRAMGANYVNISHPGLYTEKPPYSVNQDVQNNLDSLLVKIERAGMYAVISFRTGPGRSEFTFIWDEVLDQDAWFNAGYLNDAVWQDSTAQEAWASMWEYTANRYKNNPVVVGYDLMVEPNSNEVGSHALNDNLDEWEPEDFYGQYGGSLYDWNQLYPRITDAIRQVDSETPVLISCMAYSAVYWFPYLEPTEDDKTVYMFHQYDPFQYTHQEPEAHLSYPGNYDIDWDNQPDTFDRTYLEGLMAYVDSFKSTTGRPVGVNEFGVVRWVPDGASFMQDMIDLFESRGLNHAFWAWNSRHEPYASDEDDFNILHGPDPNHHSEVDTSALLTLVKTNWAKNSHFHKTGVESRSVSQVSQSFVLHGNYPNPFNQWSVISCQLSVGVRVKVAVYDVYGRIIASINVGFVEAGKFQIKLYANEWATGLYYYEVRAGKEKEVGKMVLVQ